MNDSDHANGYPLRPATWLLSFPAAPWVAISGQPTNLTRGKRRSAGDRLRTLITLKHFPCLPIVAPCTTSLTNGKPTDPTTPTGSLTNGKPQLPCTNPHNNSTYTIFRLRSK